MKRLKWGTIEYLNTLIDEYFAPSTDPANPKIPTLAGLCLHLKITRETWNYYISDKWRIHRKSDEEADAILKQKDEEVENGAFESLMEISEKSVIGNDDNIEDDAIKARVSDAFKKAHLRYTEYIEQAIMCRQYPAGPIFLAKATLGYRETAPEAQQQAQLPTKIVINILPQPEQKPIVEAHTTYSIEAGQGEDGS